MTKHPAIQHAFGRTLGFLLAVLTVGCAPRAATELVVRIDSDIPRDQIVGVDLVVTATDDGGFVTVRHEYDLTGDAFSMPGDVGVVARDPNASSRVRIDVTGHLRGGDTLQRYAIVAFQPRHALVVDMFLADRCRAASARAQCRSDESCGRTGCETAFPVPVDIPPTTLRDVIDVAPPSTDVRDVTLATHDALDVTGGDSCVRTSCIGRQCGSDQCGGTCGACLATQTCSAEGLCVCVPNCGARACGSDGCNGSCGVCPPTQSCSAGSCAAMCTTNCTARNCGDDGCGGSCGGCTAPATCNAAGRCACVPNCTGRACGPDPVCGAPCGAAMCPSGHACNASGQCVCVPNCSGRSCGPDPVCGTDCGTCPMGRSCDASGQCACMPDCTGMSCGLDPNCGVSCGACMVLDTCVSGTCCRRGICP